MRPVVILALLVSIAYAGSLYAPFVFDDLTSIQHNRAVRSFSFNAKGLLNTRSLLYPTYAFNEWLGGENVFGYHVVNLLLHIVNGLLVFGIAWRTYERLRPSPYPLPGGEGRYALLAAAFFLVHPVQTEAVTYITERSELLSKLVYLCGLLFFVALPERKIGFFASIPVLLCLVLGVGFKETAVTLPASIVLYDYIFISKAKFRNMLPRWRFYLGLTALIAAGTYAVFDILRQPLLMVGNPGTLRRWYFFITELRVIARYLRLIVFPAGQNLDYDFPPALSITEPGVLLSGLLIIGLLIIAWRWRQQKPVYAFSIFWFFITMAPLSSIVPIPDVIAEHRLYLAMAGVALSFPLLLDTFGNLHERLRPYTSRLQWAAIGVLLILTVARNYVWADEFRLFSDVVAKSPHKLRGYENLIFAYMKRGQEQEAVSVAKTAIDNVSVTDRISLLDTIGNLYLRMGRPAEAVEYFTKSNDESVRVGTTSAFLATSFNNLGMAYMMLAQMPDLRNTDERPQALRNAREAFQKSLERDPTIETLDSLVNVVLQLGEAPALENQLRKNLASNANDANSLCMMATLLSLQNRYPESLEYFRRAEVHYASREALRFNYAFALSKTGQTERAIEEYLTALQLDPLFHEADYNLALLYIQKADYASALQHLGAIVSVEAANVKANLKLAEIYAFQGNLPLARQYLQQVLKADPQDREALSLFARIGSD